MSDMITEKTIFKLAKEHGWDGGYADDEMGAYYQDLESTRIFHDTLEKENLNGDTSKTHSMYDRKPLSAESLGLSIPPAREFIFKGPGGLARNVVGIRAGQGGCGKTTMEVQICASIASDFDCTFGIHKFETTGPVIAVFSEDLADDIGRTLYHIRQSAGREIDLSSFHIFPRSGGDPRFFVKDSGGNITTTAGFERFKKMVTEIKPVYILIDSFSVVCGPGEELNADAAFTMAALSDLCELGDRAAVIVLAHSTKESLKTKGAKNSPEANLDSALDPTSIRGASALTFNSRWAATMTLVPAHIRKKLGCPEGTMLTAFAVRKTNYSRPLQISYLQHEVQFWAPGVETMILKPFVVDEVRELSDDDLKDSILELFSDNQRIKKRDLLRGPEFSEQLFMSRETRKDFVNQLIKDKKLFEVKNGKEIFLGRV